MKETCFIEAKVSVGDKPFNLKAGFKDHQLPTLIKIKEGALSFKPSDASMTTQPYDIAFSYKAKAYVAIMWVRRGNKTFYLIDPKEVVAWEKIGRKSLYEEEAMHLAEITGILK